MKWLIKHRNFFLFLAFLTGIYFLGNFVIEKYQEYQLRNADFNSRPKVVLKDQTSISPAFYTDEAFKKHLETKYPFVHAAAYEVHQEPVIGQNYVIPGLIQTKTLNLLTQKPGPATYMTPQGLTIAEDYVLISAYDSEHSHSSVIYVLDKKTGKFLKTIILKGRPHVGGLAYDPVEKNIWITGATSDGAALTALSLKKIKKYNYEKDKVPIEYDHSIILPSIQRASTVTYFDNQLFVGFFNAYDKGTIAAYTIARNGPAKGTISNDEIRSTTGELIMSQESGQSEITNQIQGIAVTADRIFLTQSFGGYDAKLYIYPISAIQNLTEANAERIIPMPPYLEQVYVSGNQMLALFESASKSYARDTITIMDRVLALNVNALLTN